MTTDLSSKTVEEMKTELFNILKRYPAHAAVETIIVSFLFELARRLKEAQQRNAAHDAKVAAEAKAEVLEEAANSILSEAENYLFDRSNKQAAEALNIEFVKLSDKAAEYRDNATEAGRKE